MCIRDSSEGVMSNDRIAAFLNAAGNGELGLSAGSVYGSVSYTHLDVYKRQPSGRKSNQLPGVKGQQSNSDKHGPDEN